MARSLCVYRHRIYELFFLKKTSYIFISNILIECTRTCMRNFCMHACISVYHELSNYFCLAFRFEWTERNEAQDDCEWIKIEKGTNWYTSSHSHREKITIKCSYEHTVLMWVDFCVVSFDSSSSSISLCSGSGFRSVIVFQSFCEVNRRNRAKKNNKRETKWQETKRKKNNQQPFRGTEDWTKKNKQQHSHHWRKSNNDT